MREIIHDGSKPPKLAGKKAPVESPEVLLLREILKALQEQVELQKDIRDVLEQRVRFSV